MVIYLKVNGKNHINGSLFFILNAAHVNKTRNESGCVYRRYTTKYIYEHREYYMGRER